MNPAHSVGSHILPPPNLVLVHTSHTCTIKRTTRIGVTLAPAPQLDGSSVVFGRVIDGGDQILEKIEGIPVYTYKAADASGSVAGEIFAAQKQFYGNYIHNVTTLKQRASQHHTPPIPPIPPAPPLNPPPHSVPDLPFSLFPIAPQSMLPRVSATRVRRTCGTSCSGRLRSAN